MDNVKQLMDAYPFYFILILTATIYELGFARKLPPLKKLATYLLLFVGCIPLTILKVLGLPMIQAMLVATILLIIVRLRRPADTRDT